MQVSVTRHCWYAYAGSKRALGRAPVPFRQRPVSFERNIRRGLQPLGLLQPLDVIEMGEVLVITMKEGRFQGYVKARGVIRVSPYPANFLLLAVAVITDLF